MRTTHVKHIFLIREAAETIGIPARTLHHHVRRGLIPCEKLSPRRAVMTADQINAVKATLQRYGAEGIRDGAALNAFLAQRDITQL